MQRRATAAAQRHASEDGGGRQRQGPAARAPRPGRQQQESEREDARRDHELLLSGARCERPGRADAVRVQSQALELEFFFRRDADIDDRVHRRAELKRHQHRDRHCQQQGDPGETGDVGGPELGTH